MVEYKTALIREGFWPAPLWPNNESVFPAWKNYSCRSKESSDPIDSLSGGVYFSTKTRRGRGKVEAWRCRVLPQIEDETLVFLGERLRTVTINNQEEMRRIIDGVRAAMPVLDIHSKRGMSIFIPETNERIPVINVPLSEIKHAVPARFILPAELTRPIPELVVSLSLSIEAGDLTEAMRQFEYRLQRGGMSDKAARGITPFTLSLGAPPKSK